MKFETYQLAKELDSFNYQQVQDDVLAILEKGSNAIVDMTACNYVSSTGLRVLLYSKKIAASKGLRLCLVGISDEVQDIMNVTGFNSFFDCFHTMDECLQAVNS
ncbi:MAG: STAS domain-containing protein [Prevotella sp.]|jgi:anti-sigma B factor antagonist|nr:STAS domain-containing protein [Prevotella sp.]